MKNNIKQKKTGKFPLAKLVVAPVFILCAVFFGWQGYQDLFNADGLQKPLPVKPSVEQLRDGDYKLVNEVSPGQEIDIARLRAPGKYTIFDFSSVF